MQLAQGLFQDITGRPDHGPYPLKDERRVSPRIPIGMRGKIRTQNQTSDAWPVTVMVRDISRQGIGLLTTDEISPGKEFMLKLRIKDEGAVQIPCIVTRCERGGLGETHFVLGAMFHGTPIPEVKTTALN